MAVRKLHQKRPYRVTLDSEGKPKIVGKVVNGPCYALAGENVEIDEPKWQHVATVGSFKGYGGGSMPFEFTAVTFAQIIKNFRANPSFVLGPDGVGTANVVQWDFHHASEAPPDEVAVNGAPAQGWVRDLKVQFGADGVELWALTEWLEPAKTYVKEGKYKWASVAVALDAVDPVSGAKIGAILTSIAITNSPFIEGMAELAAEKNAEPPGERKPGAQVRLYAYAAYSIDEAKNSIRNCLGLPVVATSAEITANLMTLAALLAGGEATEAVTGIDADKVIGDVRTILGLPLLTLPASVVKTALSLFDTEALDTGGETETGNGDGESVPGATTATKTTATKTVGEKKTMTTATLELSTIASKLGVRETPEAISAAIEGLVGIRASLTSSLELDPNISDARLAESVKSVRKVALQRRNLLALVSVLASATFTKGKIKLDGGPPPAEDDGDAPAKPGKGDALVSRLGALMSAGGVEDPDRAVAQIVKTLTDAAKLEEVMPELEELRKFSTEAKAEAESDAVAATLRDYYGDDENHKDAVVALYKSAGRKKFLEKYPPLGDDAEELVKTIAAESTHPTRTAAAPAARAKTEPATPTTPVRATKKGELPPGAVDISLYPGVNDSERAIAALKATVNGSKDWDYDTICATAFQARKDGRFINLSANAGR